MADQPPLHQQAEQLQELAEEAAKSQAQEADLLARDFIEAMPDEDDYSEMADWLEATDPERDATIADVQKDVSGFLNDYSIARAGGDPSEDFLERAKAAVQRPPQGGLSGNAEPLFVLVTLGLGEQVILNYLRDAEHMDVPVVFVLRGFDPDEGGLQGLIDSILEINQFEIEFQMQVNPVLFNAAEAEQVPVFMYTGEDDITRIRRGAVNLHAALESFDDDSLDLVIGELFEIAEPNLLDIIHERIDQFDGEQLLADARERARARLLSAQTELPEATIDDSYLVDPTVELNSDVTLPDGRVVAPAGTRVNPLEVAPWSQQFVVFDATSPWQVEQARLWAAQADVRTTFIASRLPDDDDERRALGQTLGDHVHLIDPLLVRRMDLRAVPSLVTQQGLRVRVEVASQKRREG